MDTRKLTRTGLLLLLTAGPFLVFLFLFVFGENQYVVDTYPIELKYPDMDKGENIEILLPEPNPLPPSQKNQVNRISSFVSSSGIETDFLYFGDSILAQTPALNFWVKCDTTVAIQTAKGPSTKKLPEPPRLFLVDKQKKVRGVYSLSSSLSVDTLLLELTILSKN